MTTNHVTARLRRAADLPRAWNAKQRASRGLNARCLMLLLALGFAACSARAQNYSIDWFTVDGGGGTSASGAYSVSGTVGQPDAGRMSGGSYTLNGGYWAVIAAVQTNPLLRIVLTRTNAIVVAWPAPSTGFSLQQNGVLGTTNWTSVPNPVNVVGSENQVIVSPPTGNRFYRLKSP